jgi:predicted nuclease of predicted toxin-antitoxin system
MKFLANENIPLASVYYLRKKGLDVYSISETAPGITDIEVLKIAQIEKRIILTFDNDYGELIFLHKINIPAGVVFFRFIPQYPNEPAEYIMKILAIRNLSLENYFTVVDTKKIRQRLMRRIKK